MKDLAQEQQFDSLLNNYAVAVYLSGQLLDSGLLERKIKVGNNVERLNEITRLLVPFLANDLRTAQRKINGLKNPDFAKDEFFSSSLDIANAYFDELASKGSEWEYADLEDLFIEYRSQAEASMESERDNY